MVEVSMAEMTKAEGMMTPVQRSMTKAQVDIMSHEQDFIEAGGTKELVEKTAVIASARAKKEFEALEGQDPIRRLVDVMEKSITKEDDLALVRQSETRFEDMRVRVADAVNPVISEARLRGQEIPPLRKVIDDLYAKGTIRCGYMSPEDNLSEKNPSGEMSPIAGTGRKGTDGREEMATLSLGYTEKILKGIGAIDENTTLVEGMSNGRVPGWFHGSTNIDGVSVFADVSKSDRPRLAFGFKPEAIAKMIALPRQ